MKSFEYKENPVISTKDGQMTINGLTKTEIWNNLQELPELDSYLNYPNDISRIAHLVFEYNYLRNAYDYLQMEENIYSMAEQMLDFSKSRKRTMTVYADSWDQVAFKIKKLAGGDIEIHTVYEGAVGKKMEAAGVTERSTWDSNNINMPMFRNWVRFAHYACKKNADSLMDR